MFIIGGQSLAYDIYSDESSEQGIKSNVHLDLIYNVTGGRNWTPKHINLASTL